MSIELRDQIRSNFDTKDTEELLEIWQTNDRVEWSDMAFEVLSEILKERLGVVPEQGEPILEHVEEQDELLEDWEAKILDSKEQPELYDTLEVIETIANIKKVANAAVIVYALIGITQSFAFQTILRGNLSGRDGEFLPIVWSLLTTVLTTSVKIAVVYYPLKALAYILRILVEMDFTSRKKLT